MQIITKLQNEKVCLFECMFKENPDCSYKTKLMANKNDEEKIKSKQKQNIFDQIIKKIILKIKNQNKKCLHFFLNKKCRK